jgi:microcystin-dependent protein
MPQGFLIGLPRLRFDDVNGEPLAFGRVWFSESGGSTPQDTWSNSDLSSLNTNPVVLSASGECSVFVPQADIYRVDLFDADGNHQDGWPVDGVMAIPAPDPPEPAPDPVPVGAILAYGGTTAPTGYLLCNGALISRATFDDLFAIIGTAFGAGDGSTTFGLPDLRQRFPIGLATSGTGSTLGGTGGTIDHTHTGPSHTHVTTVPRDGWGHASNIPATSGRIRTGDAAGTGTEASAEQATADQAITSAAGGTGVTGTGNPSFQAVNFIVKT